MDSLAVRDKMGFFDQMTCCQNMLKFCKSIIASYSPCFLLYALNCLARINWVIKYILCYKVLELLPLKVTKIVNFINVVVYMCSSTLIIISVLDFFIKY